jgi:hypothetical protein
MHRLCSANGSNGGSTLRFWMVGNSQQKRTGYEIRNVPLAPSHENTERLFALFGRKNVRFLID